jgi:hypothetical protein
MFGIRYPSTFRRNVLPTWGLTNVTQFSYMYTTALWDVRNKTPTFRRNLQPTWGLQTSHSSVTCTVLSCGMCGTRHRRFGEIYYRREDFKCHTVQLHAHYCPVGCAEQGTDVSEKSTTDLRTSNVTQFSYMYTTALWNVRYKVPTFQINLLPMWELQMSHSSVTCTLLPCGICGTRHQRFGVSWGRCENLRYHAVQLQIITCRKSNDRRQKSKLVATASNWQISEPHPVQNFHFIRTAAAAVTRPRLSAGHFSYFQRETAHILCFNFVSLCPTAFRVFRLLFLPVFPHSGWLDILRLFAGLLSPSHHTQKLRSYLKIQVFHLKSARMQSEIKKAGLF